MRRAEAGAVLLEVIVALAILGSAGIGLALHTRQSLLATELAQRAEQRVTEASTFLTAVSLWPIEDLDRHLGNRPNGRWRLAVLRPSPELYEVSVNDSATDAPIVHTALYRRRDAPR